MSAVLSKDGTRIAYETTGVGPTLILVNGALGHRENFGERPLAAELSRALAVVIYDRRPRGEH
jgi:hypothetical protein